MICILYVHEHTNTSRVAAFTPTDSMEKEKNIHMHLFTKQEKHFYLDKKKPNSLSDPWCF